LDDTIKGYRKKVSALGIQAASFTCEELREYLQRDEHQKIDYFAFAKDLINKISTKGTGVMQILP